MNSLLKLVVAGACPLLLANCFYAATAFNGTHRAYRTNASYGAADSTVQHLKDGAEGSPATLAFLEFDDQGEPWRSPNPKEGWQKDSRTQLSTVLAELEKQRRKGPLKTVIFIHGWNNNAKPGNPNLANFEHSLKELAAVSKSSFIILYLIIGCVKFICFIIFFN